MFRYYKNEIGKVGNQESWPHLEQVIEWGKELSQREKQFGSYSVGKLDVVKISITGHTTLSMSVAIHYSVLCERSLTRFSQWQIDTYNAIMDAYQTLNMEYEAAQQKESVSGLLSIQGRNPQLNREVEKRELKKFAISLLTGQQYESFNAMEKDYQSNTPQINLNDAAAEGSFVRFFEQAFEWRHMTYMFYPYFWGNKKNWTETVSSKDTDPLFEQFLQAGYARVWVPIRPGFELVIAHYIECGGQPWDERDAPLCEQADPGSSPMVALIDEIKEQLGTDLDFREGTLIVHQGDTLVVGTGTDFRQDDVDREIHIALKQYRITDVDEVNQRIHLREPYDGEDQQGIGYAVGPKFVGEPLVVQVPTNLVYLEAGSGLNPS